ncbi:hypothetical protein [Levilactobacillus fuyuanensis]|uniref:DUF3284 domain-containing protein n=1 Tax=Levilactobacillus fuyuanensis TaxID=2486022 RepID=A0ABW4H0T5_9LACO|nr:hypothetical protein [Levilactobacillus fuyuanensis]
MKYFQARISRETAQIFQTLKDTYEQADGKSLTQTMVISKAVDDVSVLNQWDKVINDNSVKGKELAKITDKDLRIRVQLSPQTQEKIQNYKYFFPQLVGTRSVTLGVALKFIFKGAILMRDDSTLVDFQSRDISSIIDSCKSKLAELIAPTNRVTFEAIFSEMKNEVTSLKK